MALGIMSYLDIHQLGLFRRNDYVVWFDQNIIVSLFDSVSTWLSSAFVVSLLF